MLRIADYYKFALSAQNSPDLNEVLGGNVYHMIVPADEHIKEYLVYSSTSMDEQYDKDGTFGYTVNVSVTVVAKTYEALLDILEEVDRSMHSAPQAWNAREGVQYYIANQTIHYDQELYDERTDEWIRTLTITNETNKLY